MKPIFKTVIIFILFNIFVYTAISFYWMSFNPIVWGQDSRFVFVLIGGLVGAWASAFPMIFDNENPKL